MFEKWSGYLSLGKNINKVKDSAEVSTEEGVISDLIPELKLNISDDDLIKLKKGWLDKWEKDYKNLEGKIKKAVSYWLGNPEKVVKENLFQKVFGIEVGEEPKKDNLIFEALETFLPAATRQNPEPVVSSDDTEAGQTIAEGLKNLLIYLSDTLRLKIKLKKVLRFWALSYLGAVKVGWSEKNGDISTKPYKINELILDPNGFIDDDGEYTGEYVGCYVEETAKILVEKFKKHNKYFTDKVKGNMDTKIRYIEWWTEQYVFWTLDDKVLDKIRNPHWNYDTEEPALDENGDPIETETIDDDGNTVLEQQFNITPGKNHFRHPKIPFIFLSIFSLNDKPYDNTSLIEQNIPQQDVINRRQAQIDKNVDNMNGGWIVSLQNAGLTKEQASLVSKTLREGGTAAIPSGSPADAIHKITGNSLPADVYNSLQDARNELRSIFGTSAITPQGIQSEDTVRGKIIARGSDVDRIGGGVAEYLEQFADKIYNYWVQMIYVYYDEEHISEILGEEQATSLYSLLQSENKTMRISVKEGSMIPKDSLTRRNEAVDLFTAGALDPLTLFERLEFPDPVKSAERLLAFKQGQIMTDENNQQPAQTIPTQEGATIPEQPIEELDQANLLNNVPIQ